MTLKQKIDDGSVIIGVMALGYVGLPLLRAFWDAGFNVMGFDVDRDKISQLKQGQNYLQHLGTDFVSDMTHSDRFHVTDNFSELAKPDVILVCVPTPLGKHLEPDLSFVEQTAFDIAETIRPQQLIVLESTTYPGTTREIMLPILEKGGLKAGKDFYLAYSPEREDPGRKDMNTQKIPKLVGGIEPLAGQLATSLYRKAISQVIEVSSAEVAEAAKILENVYRAVNIALVNELKIILTEMGIDIWEVVEAAATKPFGFQPFYPGPGLGGHCIPIDPFYLTWKAREIGQSTRFIELAGQVNHHMPAYVVNRTILALNQDGLAVKNARILVLGLAYKPDVDDVRESPSFELIEQLIDLGAKVDYHDPHVASTHKMRKHDLQMKSIDLSPENLKNYDCIVIATHHSCYDWEMICNNTSLIVDTRGITRKLTGYKARIFNA